MSLRILIVNEFFSYGDGSSLYISNICDELQKLGCQVSVLYGTEREMSIENNEVKKYFVPRAFGFNYVYGRKEQKKIEEIVSTVAPHVNYIHQVLNPHAISLFARLTPSIRFEHGFRLSCVTGRRMPRKGLDLCCYAPGLKCLLRAHTQKCMPRNPVLAFKRIKDFYLNKNAHNKIIKIIVASNFIKDLLLLSGFNKNKIEVIPYYTTLPNPDVLDVKRKIPNIVCVSRMEKEKGIDYFIKALSFIQIPCKVYIIGEGTQIPYLKKIANSISTNHEIIFTGWIDNNKLGYYYSNASLVVLPSIWPEPFGIVGIEAMAYQRPVVAFDVGGISEWLQNEETGFLVKSKDVKGLAEKIEFLLKRPDIAEKYGEKGVELVKNRFEKHIHLNHLFSLFEKAIRISKSYKRMKP